MLGMKIADWQVNTKGQTRDFVFLVSEAIADECKEFRHASFVVDITTETRPFSVATYQVPESKGKFCPREAGFYIPATTERTAERCVTNGARSCKVAIQTNNVEADERGLIYLADRAGTGLHIVKLIGAAAKIVAGN